MATLFKRILFIILFVPTLLAPAEPSDTYYRTLREGIRLYRANLLNDAKRVFRELHKEHEDSLVVIRYLMRITIHQQQWGDAKDWCQEILDQQKDDVQAHYYLGIAYRETGKYKAFILQGRDWRRAERSFLFVIDNYGHYKDIYYQYALLKNYWKDYARAVELAETQLMHAPNDTAYSGVHRFYQSFLYNQSKDFHEWSLKRSGHRNALYLGESYRHRNEFLKADSIFHVLAQTAADISGVPLYIALAKVKYQLQQEDSSQFYYEKAIRSIASNVDAALMFEDMKYIMSDAEWFEYRDLTSYIEKRAFFERMWLARNPTPASKINYRIIEHMRRVIRTEKDFFYDGVRSQVNNPDKLNYLSFPRVFELNDKYNDKGLVYIRHGEADDRAFTLQAEALNETWVYYPRGQLNQKFMFHFWQDDNMAGNNWRFIPSIPQYMAESRLTMDPIFGRLYTANTLEALAIDQEMKIQSHDIVETAMNTDQHSWEDQLRSIIFPFYLATFREAPNLSRCELYYSLKKDDLLPPNAAHTAQDTVAISFAAFDMEYNLAERLDNNVQIKDIVDSSETMGYWPSQFNFISPPGSYQLALDIQTPSGEAIGGYKFRFSMSDYAEESMNMSGLVLAHAIRPASQQNIFYKNGFTVIPNPGKVYDRKKPIDIYFELYNVSEGNGKRQNFIVRYQVRLLEERSRGLVQRIGRIFRRSQPSISNEVERETTTPTSVEYIALDLGKNVPGIYELNVSAFIPGKQDTASRKINFELK
ncbi:GWxTD domain-containing protein [candidate division KSB1 bacterium]|nr:GWxTD domain-containing protein [candidate division KSB1 bacterium]RQW00109.1 MAG: GWxTD domain-containing protein [candidate division KSB1 bacterium]